jgi:hypothetical protein
MAETFKLKESLHFFHPDSLDKPTVTILEAWLLKWKKPCTILLIVKLPQMYLTRPSNV